MPGKSSISKGMVPAGLNSCEEGDKSCWFHKYEEAYEMTNPNIFNWISAYERSFDTNLP